MSKREKIDSPHHYTHVVSWSTLSNHSYQLRHGQVLISEDNGFQDATNNVNKYGFQYEDDYGEGDNNANDEGDDDYYNQTSNQKVIKKKKTKKKPPHMISEHNPSQLELVPYIIQSSSLNIFCDRDDPDLDKVESVSMVNHEMYKNGDNKLQVESLSTVFWGKRKSRFMHVLDMENFNGTLGPYGFQIQINERKSLRGVDEDESQHSFLNEVKQNGYNDENGVRKLKGNLVNEESETESEEKSSIFISDDSQLKDGSPKKKKKGAKKKSPGKTKAAAAAGKKPAATGAKGATSKSPAKPQNKAPGKIGTKPADKNQLKQATTSKSPPNKTLPAAKPNQKETAKEGLNNKKNLKPIPTQQLQKQASKAANVTNNKSPRDNEKSNSNSPFPNEKFKTKFHATNNKGSLVKQKSQLNNTTKSPNQKNTTINQKDKPSLQSIRINKSKEEGNQNSLSDLSNDENDPEKKHQIFNRNKQTLSHPRILSNKQSNASTGFSKNNATPTSAAINKAKVNKSTCNVIEEKGKKKNKIPKPLNHNKLSKSPEDHKNKTGKSSRDNSGNQRPNIDLRNNRQGNDGMSDDFAYNQGQYPLKPVRHNKHVCHEDVSQTNMMTNNLKNVDRMMSNLTYKYYDERMEHYKQVISNPFNPYSSYYNSRFLNPQRPEIRYEDKAFSVMMPSYKDNAILKHNTGVKSVPNVFIPKGYNTSNTLQTNNWGMKTTKNINYEDVKSNFFIK